MIMIGMATRVVEFSNGGYKIRKIFPKNKHTQRKLLNFEFCKTQNSIIGLMASCQKVPKFDFQSQFFYVKNHPTLSQFFFH